MKKLIAVVLAVSLVLILVLGSGIALADKPEGKGNGAPSGRHYNLNIIGVPNQKNANFDGGNGARIFVDRTGQTLFYVQAGDSYQILDHDGTDGKVGQSRVSPGIILPYSSGEWDVEIWVRLVGPVDSEINWKSYYWDGTSMWVKFADFNLEKSSKFSLKTGQLLANGYEDILWELNPLNKFRILQMRIYVNG